MGVQDVIASLNKSKLTTTEPVPPLPPKKDLLTLEQQQQQKKKTKVIKTGIAANLKKFDQNSNNDYHHQHPPTPPESPRATVPTTKKANVTPNSGLLRFDAIAAELVEMHSTLIRHTEDSDLYIQKLQSDVDKYASDVTKVRDYEIRVEYLAQKLEQLSEEKEQLEQELTALRQQGPSPQPPSKVPPPVTHHPVTSPLSPVLTQYFSNNNQNQNMTVERTEKQNEEFMADILNVYEEMPDDVEQDEMQIFDEQQVQDEISVLNERLVEYDKSVQMTIAKYVTDLETQRLEVKRLEQVVKKQDELISKLELKSKSSSDELLREQVELQKIELDNKRELLSQLLNEREELLNRLRRYSHTSHSSRLSIDVNEWRRMSSSSPRHSLTGRGSPPPTAPPSQPLPPLPLREDSNLR